MTFCKIGDSQYVCNIMKYIKYLTFNARFLVALVGKGGLDIIRLDAIWPLFGKTTWTASLCYTFKVTGTSLFLFNPKTNNNG
jgi:hypothetical protein